MNLSPNYMIHWMIWRFSRSKDNATMVLPIGRITPPIVPRMILYLPAGQTNMAMERHLDWSSTLSKQPFVNLQNQIRSLSFNLQPNSCYLQEVWNFNILTWQNVHTWWILWVQKHNMLGCNHPMLCWWICILDCGWITVSKLKWEFAF